MTDYAHFKALPASERDALGFIRTGQPTMPSALVQKVIDGLHPLCAWRQAAGLTQAQLGEKAGVRAATISDMETGIGNPRLSTIIALADALMLDPGDILPGRAGRGGLVDEADRIIEAGRK